LKLLSLQKGLRRGNVESSISPYTKTIGLFGIARIELHLAFRDCRPQWNFLRTCDALAERFRSEPLDSNRSVTGSRLVGSDLRTYHRFWSDYGLLGNWAPIQPEDGRFRSVQAPSAPPDPAGSSMEYLVRCFSLCSASASWISRSINSR
jgi:hypothetical protein